MAYMTRYQCCSVYIEFTKICFLYFQALLDLQNRVQQYVQNFKFNLAFSGVGYKKGSDTQIKGDLLLTSKY